MSEALGGLGPDGSEVWLEAMTAASSAAQTTGDPDNEGGRTPKETASDGPHELLFPGLDQDPSSSPTQGEQ